MNLLPKSHEEFSQKEYWDSFFKKRGNKAFEWYGEYPELAEHLHKYIKKQDNVLIVGCGNSSLGSDLYDIGYKNITNIDISPVVIRQMLSKNGDKDTLKYIQMDALDMAFDSEEFNVVIDKGTLDALMPNDRLETLNRINTYFRQIERVLKFGGRYICISLLQKHILTVMLSFFPKNNWMFRAVRCFEPEKKAIENSENSMPVFVIICTKFKELPRQILEINLTTSDKMERLDNIEDVITNITCVQQAAFVCSGLRQTSIADDNEVSLDLYRPGQTEPRYTVYIVDVPNRGRNVLYAAFIVPQGREAEWLFSTKAGHRHLVKMTGQSRLAIITMHRNSEYESFEAVQNELKETVCNLAPPGFTNKKIPFLSLGSDVGNRVVRHKGHSSLSGEYVVEDVEIDNNQKFRRLIYLNSQLVIQSEARIKTVKSRRGLVKELVDLTHLTSVYHVYMSAATYMACQGKESPSVLVVGLGGGGLCSYLHKFIPKAAILGIDIDEEMLKVATEWFGFQQDDKLKARIADGVEFLQEAADKGQKVDAILFDVDSKDTSIGMSCPPKLFLEDQVLDNVVRLLTNTGCFILNVVLRDQTLRPSILKILRKKFKTIAAYQLEEDLNEIFFCKVSKVKNEELFSKVTDACSNINVFIRKHNGKADLNIDLNTFTESLKINS